jgi:hypothetical protein
MHVDAASQPALSTCKNDADCELVNEACCGCNEGGKRIAVLKGQAPRRNCEGTMCPQMISNDPSCLGVARAYCKAGKCELSSANDQELHDPLQGIK